MRPILVVFVAPSLLACSAAFDAADPSPVPPAASAPAPDVVPARGLDAGDASDASPAPSVDAPDAAVDHRAASCDPEAYAAAVSDPCSCALRRDACSAELGTSVSCGLDPSCTGYVFYPLPCAPYREARIGDRTEGCTATDAGICCVGN